MRALITVLAALLVLTACGVRPQDRPEPISIPTPSATDRESTVTGGSGPSVTVYFVRGSRLEAARRSAPSPAVSTALEALAVGPAPSEVVGGLRTALAPQDVRVVQHSPEAATLVIEVTREFIGVTGANQLLAVAQLVWTATEFPDVRRIRLTAENTPLEIPTDAGLTDASVSRQDFASVAPPRQTQDGDGDGDGDGATTPPDGAPAEKTPPATPSPSASPSSTPRRRR